MDYKALYESERDLFTDFRKSSIEAVVRDSCRYAALQTKVRDYLTLSSIDGKSDRQTLRKELAEMVK